MRVNLRNCIANDSERELRKTLYFIHIFFSGSVQFLYYFCMESSEITTKTCRQAQLCSTEVQQDLS